MKLSQQVVSPLRPFITFGFSKSSATRKFELLNRHGPTGTYLVWETNAFPPLSFHDEGMVGISSDDEEKQPPPPPHLVMREKDRPD
ncbi:hypothetical protein RUM44_011272 [Polyplax serrata]|uniref:Uncharacterized protein n=1 Tax=Polyplax serrata TaxID=468196 RepID=A0ABR1APK1_POLSC